MSATPMPIITRAGTAPLQPETVQDRNGGEHVRHPETGKFIRTGTAPVKRGGSQPRGKAKPA